MLIYKPISKAEIVDYLENDIFKMIKYKQKEENKKIKQAYEECIIAEKNAIIRLKKNDKVNKNLLIDYI